MIALIRTKERGYGKDLCQLDLLKFTEEQVRNRMKERGIKDDTFFICGFVDWEVDRIMSLSEAYLLKRCLLELYDGDSFIIRYLLKRGLSVTEIVTKHYLFLSKDETIAMQSLLQHADIKAIIDFFYKSGTWVNAINAYVERGILLNTPKGFYIRRMEGS
ncbi:MULTISPECIES: hypothetical protein [Streptococcus]|uniref:hypothetical protein n=1 Tax=Streptococcus TaxID=1301 RepID=UPI0003805C58|nr:MULTISPECIES: hypothetical protein [Streptococcus]MCB2836305.1 hypothetical protein [Streptococcus dysgalactiae subsp. dysgalactiae]MDY2962724.1 hypothetical protein [Streptococcus dysgalactiae]GFE43979.1 hypothetical protein ScFU1_16600 [Streptococcus canis]VTS96532.1 Uncharacterised protein [Streptococcus dysgalactiae]